MMELTTKTMTGDSRIGSHSADSPTMTFSSRGRGGNSGRAIRVRQRAPSRARGGFHSVGSSGPPRIKRQGEHAIIFDDFAVGIARCIDFAKAKPRQESHGSMVLGGDGCVKRPYRELGLEEIYRRDTRLRGDAV